MRFPSRFLLALALAFAPLAKRIVADDTPPPSAIDLDAALSLDKLSAQLASKRVVFVGETHDRYDHHLNQLEIIRRLHQLDPNLAIGVEYLPQPSQARVDDYIAGKISEKEFLQSSGYYQSWGYDYRLYAPIFRFAREQRIPVRALNVPGDVASTAGKLGIAGLSPQQRAFLPKEIVPADEDYRKRLREAFEAHKDTKPGAFDHFVEAQTVWDEGMAMSAAVYLNANPSRRMVILAGSGHIAFGSGIPRRLARTTQSSYAIVLNGGDDVEPRMADYVLLTQKQDLPPAAVLGVSLEDKDGACRVRSVTPSGAAEKAGIKKGETLVSIDGEAIQKIADMRVLLWEKKPGDRVHVGVQRKGRPARMLDVTLGAAPKV